jgi:hypothetical protein
MIINHHAASTYSIMANLREMEVTGFAVGTGEASLSAMRAMYGSRSPCVASGTQALKLSGSVRPARPSPWRYSTAAFSARIRRSVSRWTVAASASPARTQRSPAPSRTRPSSSPASCHTYFQNLFWSDPRVVNFLFTLPSSLLRSEHILWTPALDYS